MRLILYIVHMHTKLAIIIDTTSAHYSINSIFLCYLYYNVLMCDHAR